MIQVLRLPPLLLAEEVPLVNIRSCLRQLLKKTWTACLLSTDMSGFPNKKVKDEFYICANL